MLPMRGNVIIKNVITDRIMFCFFAFKIFGLRNLSRFTSLMSTGTLVSLNRFYKAFMYLCMTCQTEDSNTIEEEQFKIKEVWIAIYIL